jgi:C-terminal processing protease CtpA/Prc
MKLLINVSLVFLVSGLNAQHSFDAEKMYHPDSLKRWTHSVMHELSIKHPGFYRHTSKERFNHLIDSTINSINDSLTELEYYRKLKPLFARIGCLHTGISLSADYQNYLERTSKLLPFEVFVDKDRRVFITKNHSDQDLPVKSEILSVNDRPIGEILRILFNAIPSDGYNQTVKFLVLNHHFALWYQTVVDASHTFKIEIQYEKKPVTLILKGVSKDVFPSMEALESANVEQLRFDRKGKIGVLTIHSFAKSVIKRNGQHYRRFVKKTFREIADNKVNDLVIDLRYNTGGTDGNAAFLASHFFDKPFRYWDRIEVTESVAREIKGVYRIFYKKPVKRDSIYHWKKIWITNEFDYYQKQKPARNNFKGNTYLLTNGLCMSSCSDLVAILSHNKKAVIVGQETGGGFQGNNSGMMPKAKIPPGLTITVPLQKYTNAVDSAKNFGRGSIPDYEVAPTIDDWIDKRDVESEFVMQMLNGRLNDTSIKTIFSPKL